MSLTVNEPINVFFVQISTLTPSMHQKLSEHGKSCMQINQLPSDRPNELTDKYNIIEN
jgi:hypothetical protein